MPERRENDEEIEQLEKHGGEGPLTLWEPTFDNLQAFSAEVPEKISQASSDVLGGQTDVPMGDAPVRTGCELDDHLNDMLEPEGMDQLAADSPRMNEKMRKLMSDVESASDVRELQKVDSELMRYRGTVMEHMVESTLSQNFNEVVYRHTPVDTEEGRTRIDVELKDANRDFEIGDLHVAKGENLDIEVKSGSANYIQAQFDHVLKQVTGHGKNSLVITTKEYLDTDVDKREEFEAKLAERGSHLWVTDISTGKIDRAIWALLSRN